MKRILLIGGGIVGLLLVAALTVPFFIPKSVYKAQIEKAAASALQRDVQLRGDVSVSVFPRISASVKDVFVANPDGFASDHMIQAGELRGSVKWLPLLSRRVDVSEIAFVDADVQLQKLEDGRVNWQFGSGAADETGAGGSGGDVKAAVDQARLKNASLTFRDDAAGKTYELKDLNLEASLQAMDKPLKAKADGLFQEERFDVDLVLDSPAALTGNLPANVTLELDSRLAAGGYTGTVTLGEAPTLAGDLSLKADSLADLAKFADMDLPLDVAPLGAATVKASLSGALAKPDINFETLGLKSQLIDLDYTGGLSLAGDMPTLDGTVKALLPSTGDLTRQMGLDLPAEDALERVQLDGGLRGPVDALALKGATFSHSGALLNATFTGDVSLAGDGRIDGALDASSTALRALLAAADVEMAPGDALQSFKAAGKIGGSFKNVGFKGLDLTLDDIRATGDAGLDLSGARPRLTGDLDMGALDLSPFLAPADQEAKPKQPMTAWSKEPLDLAGLKSVDADLDIHTTRLSLGNVTLSDASIDAALDNGRLIAELPSFGTFGGTWAGKLTLDASGARPVLNLDMTGDSVTMSSLLGTLAGFDKLTGTGAFTVSASSSGQSIDEIMRGLDGKVATKLNDGALKGLNVSQLVRSAQSLQQALATGNLKNLDFAAVLSPTAETDFTSFESVLSINDGVANVDLMKVLNPVLGIDGSGVINLGGQSLDLRLATSIDKKGQGTGSVIQLNGIPVPVRLSGAWSNLKVTPDLSGIQAALTANLGNQIKEGLGGGASGILDGILGLPGTQAPATPQEGDTAQPAEQPATPAPAPAKPKSQEDAARDAALDVFGGLLGLKTKPEEPAEDPETEDTGN